MRLLIQICGSWLNITTEWHDRENNTRAKSMSLMVPRLRPWLHISLIMASIDYIRKWRLLISINLISSTKEMIGLGLYSVQVTTYQKHTRNPMRECCIPIMFLFYVCSCSYSSDIFSQGTTPLKKCQLSPTVKAHAFVTFGEYIVYFLFYWVSHMKT